jgi:hypothetical protein
MKESHASEWEGRRVESTRVPEIPLEVMRYRKVWKAIERYLIWADASLVERYLIWVSRRKVSHMG